jgi:hypothetical protein
VPAKNARKLRASKCGQQLHDGEEAPFAGHTLELVSAALHELEP